MPPSMSSTTWASPVIRYLPFSTRTEPDRTGASKDPDARRPATSRPVIARSGEAIERSDASTFPLTERERATGVWTHPMRHSDLDKAPSACGFELPKRHLPLTERDADRPLRGDHARPPREVELRARDGQSSRQKFSRLAWQCEVARDGERPSPAGGQREGRQQQERAEVSRVERQIHACGISEEVAARLEAPPFQDARRGVEDAAPDSRLDAGFEVFRHRMAVERRPRDRGGDLQIGPVQ